MEAEAGSVAKNVLDQQIAANEQQQRQGVTTQPVTTALSDETKKENVTPSYAYMRYVNNKYRGVK